MLFKIVKNKLAILVLLIFLFILFSYIENSLSLDRKDESHLGNQSKENATADNNNEELIEKEEIIEDEKRDTEDKTEDMKIPPTKKPNPTATPANDGLSVDFLFYPDGNLIEKSSSAFTMESGSDPTDITNWYKGKIQELKMGAVSTVQTNTNGNVLNKISASNGSVSIEVEISRPNGSQTARITVKLL